MPAAEHRQQGQAGHAGIGVGPGVGAAAAVGRGLAAGLVPPGFPAAVCALMVGQPFQSGLHGGLGLLAAAAGHGHAHVIARDTELIGLRHWLCPAQPAAAASRRHCIATVGSIGKLRPPSPPASPARRRMGQRGRRGRRGSQRGNHLVQFGGMGRAEVLQILPCRFGHLPSGSGRGRGRQLLQAPSASAAGRAACGFATVSTTGGFLGCGQILRPFSPPRDPCRPGLPTAAGSSPLRVRPPDRFRRPGRAAAPGGPSTRAMRTNCSRGAGRKLAICTVAA